MIFMQEKNEMDGMFLAMKYKQFISPLYFLRGSYSNVGEH
jgi:hypothetical protein